MTQQLQFNKKILKSNIGKRIDQVLTTLLPNNSRSRIKKWILDKKIKINGKIINKPSTKILTKKQIIINIPIEENKNYQPQNIPLNIIYEDNEIIIINKPYNLVVHPGAGNPNGTILNALLYHYPKIINVPRAGIIHRLDKNTTGLMIIAKTTKTQIYLTEALKSRNITREYEAIVCGCINTNGTINASISRHKTKRTQMTINPLGKQAITHYYVIENFRNHTRIRLKLESGRTHQIRVHMAYINHPLIGDPLYNKCQNSIKNTSKKVYLEINNFNRQALHAVMLRFYVPNINKIMEWHSEIPNDMIKLINLLKADINKK